MLGLGEGELGTELSFLPKNRSSSREVDSGGTFLVILLRTLALVAEDIHNIQELRTDKKENQIFLINKEIQNGAVAKSYIYGERPPHIWGNICAFLHILGSPSSNMNLQLLHSEFPYT